jgi:hypothetical protein
MHVWPLAPSYKNEVLRYWLGYDALPWHETDLEHAIPHRAAHDAAVTALVLREAIKALPKYGCCGNHGVCHGTEDANAARAHARRTAGLEVEP